MYRTYDSAQDAYYDLLLLLSQHGQMVPPVADATSVGSQFGRQPRSTTELLGYGFSLSNARARLIKSSSRRIDLPYAIANAIWTFKGADDLETIAFYNTRGIHFSADGKRLLGAVGARIFSSNYGDQFAGVVQRLKSDRSSRRAAVQVFSPSDLLDPILNTPCTLSLQYFIRSDRLVAITYMRSQSALMVLPYDIFVFTMLHEALAHAVSVGLGPYYHICGSLHFYEDEANTVTSVLMENKVALSPMPTMTSSAFTDGSCLFEAEVDLRNRLMNDPNEVIDIAAYGLDRYWSDLLRVLVAGIRGRIGGRRNDTEMASVPEIYRSWILDD